MKTKLIVLLLVFLGSSCKENTEKIKLDIKEEEQETLEIQELSPLIDELTRFVEPVFSDSINNKEVLIFKELDSTGTITPIAMDRAVALYKNMTRRQRVSSLPIFEVLDTNTAVLVVQGAGFGGALWAKILIDKETLEIKRIAFEHKAESEGYGDAITHTSFEDQFIGLPVNLNQKTFILKKSVNKSRGDEHIIDVVSGATTTCHGAVEMVNEGLQRYREYLKDE